MFILPRPSKLRALLILGRVSNLPTVWTNCLAGWWLAGGGSVVNLLRVSVCTSFFYIGGMFLNDAFDADFDRNHRPTRPIPAGVITEKEVWRWGFGWLALGLLGLVGMGPSTAIYAVALVLCILFYDLVHKMVAVSPMVMGACRVLVYLTAGSVGFSGVNGEIVWKGLALGGYIVGLSYFARKESAPQRLPYWPCVPLAAPIIVAALFDDALDQRAAVGCGIILIAWVGWTLPQALGKNDPNIGRAVSRLLAGIALVDWLAVANISHFATILFPVFFLIALLLQRVVPPT